MALFITFQGFLDNLTKAADEAVRRELPADFDTSVMERQLLRRV